jgi:hypothetical protein
MAASIFFAGSTSAAHPCALDPIRPASPVLDQCSRIVQTDLFSLVDQPFQLALPRRSCYGMQSITEEGFMDTKYERVAEVARAMTEGAAIVLVVVDGKEGSGYAFMRTAD